MTQQLELIREVKLPEKGTMLWDLLMALQNGEELTPLVALQKYDCLSLSQRMGELKRAGWKIHTQMIEVPSGKRVAKYWMEA